MQPRVQSPVAAQALWGESGAGGRAGGLAGQLRAWAASLCDMGAPGHFCLAFLTYFFLVRRNSHNMTPVLLD